MLSEAGPIGIEERLREIRDDIGLAVDEFGEATANPWLDRVWHQLDEIVREMERQRLLGVA